MGIKMYFSIYLPAEKNSLAACSVECNLRGHLSKHLFHGDSQRTLKIGCPLIQKSAMLIKRKITGCLTVLH
jgi:hypothetical protein